MKKLEVALVTSNGSIVAALNCPDCGGRIYLDDEQFRGRRAVKCAHHRCTYHGVNNFSKYPKGEMTSNASHLRR